jgi:16S rRNA (guanine(966)-N(2))-methyltransferase RsmD
MRVIAGSARGRKLLSVPGDKTRPITDRVKEALFNIIREDLPGANFLDLFAGTGSVGIEALSQAASQALFIDSQPAAIQTIKKNLTKTELADKAQVRRTDAFLYLSQAYKTNFDYVYIAPPQYKEMWRKALHAVDANHDNLLVDDAWVIVQINKREHDPIDLEYLEEFDRRTYGNTRLVFYEHKQAS